MAGGRRHGRPCIATRGTVRSTQSLRGDLRVLDGLKRRELDVVEFAVHPRAREGVTRKQHFAERLNLVEQDRSTLRERYRK